MKKRIKAMHMLRGIAFVVIYIGVVSLLVMLLWNALIPSLIGWGAVSYWQAAGLLILCRLLFRGFGHHRHHHHPFGRGRMGHWGDPRFEQMHDEMKEEMRNMSRTEKIEYIRKRMAEHHSQAHHES